MRATSADGRGVEALAINEVSLLRAGPQAAKLRILVDGRERLAELVCDGALVCTPAGSTAYNYSAHGPILPIGSDVLALTADGGLPAPALARGAAAEVGAGAVRGAGAGQAPGHGGADSRSVRDVGPVEIGSEPDVRHRLLFDPGHGLEERLIREQFA